MEAQYRLNQSSPEDVKLTASPYSDGHDLLVEGVVTDLALAGEDVTSVVRNDSMCFAHLVLFDQDGNRHDFAVDSSQRKALDDIVAKVFDQ